MTILSSVAAPSNPAKHPVLEAALIAARERIQVTDKELDEARSRRQRMMDALRREFGGRCYVNGSVAHGDALTPLTDVDLGVVYPNESGLYGPGRKGPADLQERAARALRSELAADFPNLRISWVGQHRAVFVQFGDPVTAGQKDFTADVIVALDNPNAPGLFIPDYDSWDRSDPEAHTRMIADRNRGTEAAFARVVRLAKHWARTHERPLCSWNIKALALGVLVEKVSMLDGLRLWFEYAPAELRKGLTADPAGVAPDPIALPDGWTVRETVRELEDARDRMLRAVRFEEEGYPALALDELAKAFRDPKMLPGPNLRDLQDDIDRKQAADASSAANAYPATIASNNQPAPRRAWGM
jgi:hypothetical protein